MNCSLNCFFSFLEAKTKEQQASVINRYKKTSSGSSKGMVVYYKPALSLMRGRLAEGFGLSEKLATLRSSCIIESWPEKLNDARIAANTLAYKAFLSEFGDKKLEFFSNPRLQCKISEDLDVNLQPELFVKVDGSMMMWKLGMSKKGFSESSIRTALQMLWAACRHKGLQLPIDQIRFFDMRKGQIYVEQNRDETLENRLKPIAQAFAKAWNKIS